MPGRGSRRVLVVAAVLVLGLAGCSDTAAEAEPTPSGAPSGSATVPAPAPSTPSLTPLPRPSGPSWPTPRVSGTPVEDAPLPDRVRFAIARQVQVAAGRTAPTTVSCPGLDTVEEPGRHTLTCSVRYAGKALTGRLTVDSERYNASYGFTSDSVAIVRPKVVDAVRRAAPDAARITCATADVAVVATDGPGIGCDVTTTRNAVQSYRARISGTGQVFVIKA